MKEEQEKEEVLVVEVDGAEDPSMCRCVCVWVGGCKKERKKKREKQEFKYPPSASHPFTHTG